eukprot:gene5961-9960_t
MNEFSSLEQNYVFVEHPNDKNDKDYETSFKPEDPQRIHRTKRRTPLSITKTSEKMKEKDFILENPTKILYQAIPFEFRKEKEFVLKVLSLTEETGVFYIYLPLSMRLDSEICKTALNHVNLSFSLEKSFIQYIPEKLSKSKEIFEAIVDSKLRIPILEHTPPKFQTKEIILKVLKKYPKDFNWVNIKFKTDKDILLLGISDDYLNFTKYVTDELKSDEVFIKNVVEKNRDVYKEIPTKMKLKNEIIEIALTSPNNCSHVPAEYFNENLDKAIGFFTKKSYYCTYLPNSLQSNADFLKKLIPKHTWCYLPKFCFETLLKNDEDFVIQHITENPRIFKVCKALHQNEKLLNLAYSLDKTVICSLESIPKNKLIQYLDESPELINSLNGHVKSKYEFDADFEVYKIRENPTEFAQIGARIQDRAEMQRYLNISGVCLNWAHKFQKDKESVLIAIKSSGEALEFADPSFYSDKEVMLAACGMYGRNLSFGSDEMKDDFDIVKAAVTNNGTSIKFASKRLRLSPVLSLIAIEQSRLAYRDLDASMKTHIDIWLIYTRRYRLIQPNKQERLKDVHFLFN